MLVGRLVSTEGIMARFPLAMRNVFLWRSEQIGENERNGVKKMKPQKIKKKGRKKRTNERQKERKEKKRKEFKKKRHRERKKEKQKKETRKEIRE